MTAPDTSAPSLAPAPEALACMQVLAESMAQVLGQVAGAAFPIALLEAPPPEASPPDKTDMQVLATAAGALRGEMSLRLPGTAVLCLAQLFLSEAQDPKAEFKAEHREAAEELLRQIAGQAATALGPRWGEVHLRLEFGNPPSWPAALGGWMGSAPAAPSQVWLEWQMSSALLAALRAPAAAASPSPAVPAPGPSPASSSGGKLDLLMDVELDVTLRFGGRRMLLREIIELGPGSVVELDRQVQEPADLLLDGKLIARGEVVVVDGNYGLRVLEVVSPPPRGMSG
jgi:flagellar motor switch protein FliN